MKKLLAIFIMSFLLFMFSPASAEEVVIRLGGMGIAQCGETSIVEGVEISVIPTTQEDCTIDECIFVASPDYVWLFQARLNLDLSGLSGTVEQVEIDFVDWCGEDCTNFFLYNGPDTVDNASNGIISFLPHTLILSADGAPVDRLAVSSCDGQIVEIRITLGADIQVSAADFEDLRVAKQEVLQDLTDLLPTDDKKDDRHINKAIKHLDKSLSLVYWEKNGYLLTDKGKKVFDHEKKAVRHLMKVKNSYVQDSITTLVDVDLALAENAIEMALEQAKSEGCYVQEITETNDLGCEDDCDLTPCQMALVEIDKAYNKLEDGMNDLRYDKAIKFYKKAWKHARKSMKRLIDTEE